MKKREDHILPQDKDRHLDIPQEARRDNHINFLDIEETGNDTSGENRKDKTTEERQKEWREGLEEGKKANRESD